VPTSSPSQQRGQDFLLCFFRGAGGKQWKVREFHGKWECNGSYGDLWRFSGIEQEFIGISWTFIGHFMGFHGISPANTPRKTGLKRKPQGKSNVFFYIYIRVCVFMSFIPKIFPTIVVVMARSSCWLVKWTLKWFVGG
jgi:hypothetical protein